MGGKLVFGLTLILSILFATSSCVWMVSEFRGEEIEISVEGPFGQIEIKDTISKLKGFFDFEIETEETDILVYTGWRPIDRIIEIRVLTNDGVFEEYVDYVPLENNIYEIANVTIIMNSGYEPIGYFNQVERDITGLIWIGLWLLSAIILFSIFDHADTRWAYRMRMKRDEQRLEADRKKREQRKADERG